MDVAQACAQLAHMHAAEQSRFYRDNAQLDTLLMRRWQGLSGEEEAVEEDTLSNDQQQGDGHGDSESNSQSAA
jgi:hypothetical protein